MELWDETPTAAQAAVGVSVCGVIPASDVPRRIRLVVAIVAAKNLAMSSSVAAGFMNHSHYSGVSTRVATRRQVTARPPVADLLRRNAIDSQPICS